MTLIIAAVIILIAVIGVAFMMKKTPAGKTISPDQPSPSSAPTKTSPDQEYRAILDSLLGLNILLRKDALFNSEMKTEIEGIIDDLMVITPQMIERYPGEALTYEIKKIGSSHLFKTVKEYLDLSPESRETQAGMFGKTIGSLKEVSNRSRDIVEKNETAEFKTMANFLAGKFS